MDKCVYVITQSVIDFHFGVGTSFLSIAVVS
jgi:hypothetical protein